MRAELLSLLLILAESATKSHRSRSRSRTGSPFLDQELNNTIVLVTTGEDLTLNCRVDRLQKWVVSWSVTRAQDSSLDLLTVGNLTFSGDSRHSIIKQRHNDWVLIIREVTSMDEGTYMCTLQTYPAQNIMVNVRVLAPSLVISSSGGDSVYTAGSSLSLTCSHLNSSLLAAEMAAPSTALPWLPGPPLPSPLPPDILVWTRNNKTFSTRNRKRVSARQVGARTVSVLTIASSLEEDSGNYTCTVPDLGLSASLEIIIQQESECYVNTTSH